MATRDTYTKVHEEWKDKPDKSTPLLGVDMEHIEEGIATAMDNRALKEVYGDKALSLLVAYSGGAPQTGAGSVEHGAMSSAPGDYAYAGGYNSAATGRAAHSEGENTAAPGTCAHAEGCGTKAIGPNTHAEGRSTVAGFAQSPSASNSSHAEGNETLAAGNCCHAEGDLTVAGQNPGTYAAHAEGAHTIATGSYSHAEGYATIANSAYQHVQGRYNEPDTQGKYVHIVGGGNAGEDRRNIHTLDWEGNAVYLGDVAADGGEISLRGLKAAIDALGQLGTSGDLSEYVKKEEGKTLSDNNYTDEDSTLVRSIMDMTVESALAILNEEAA